MESREPKLFSEDLKVLLRSYDEFWPNDSMSENRRYNAIARLFIYIGVMLSIFKQDLRFIVLSVILCGIILIIDRDEKKEKLIIASHYFPEVSGKVEGECMKPTSENPFSNVLMNEYETNPLRPPACKYEDVSKETNDKFFSNFYQDKFDIYNKKHFQRQFHSMPVTTIPNEQKVFAEFLYGKNKVCKENPEVCTGYE